jgi:hypothetical protein
MVLAFGNFVVQNVYPDILWTALAGPAGIFQRDVKSKKTCTRQSEFGISRRKQFCVLPNERLLLCKRPGDAKKTKNLR